MAINQEIISTSWEGQQKSFIEAGLKSLLQQMLGLLEGPLAANSVGSNQLTQELRDVINSIGSKVPNTRTVNNKELSNNITLSQSDIPGLVAALAAKVGYSDDEWLQVKACAMQAATAVPNTTTVNGKQLNDNIVIGMADIPGLLQAIANAGSGAVSVTTNQDGTFVIHVGETDYTINLSHTHEGMAKLVKCTEATLPQTLEDDTIYVQVDNLTTPSEIEALHIFGLEFTGGGAAAPGVPYLSSPSANISMGDSENGSVTNAIRVKGRFLTQALSATLTGTGYAFDTTQPTGVTRNSDTSLTITADAAKAGVDISVVYTGTAFNATGTLVITSSSPDNIDTESTLLANELDTDGLIAHWDASDAPSSGAWVDRINSMKLNLGGTAAQTSDGYRLNNLSAPKNAWLYCDSSHISLLNSEIDKEFTCIIDCEVKFTAASKKAMIIDFGGFGTTTGGLAVNAKVNQEGTLVCGAKKGNTAITAQANDVQIPAFTLDTYIPIRMTCGIRVASNDTQVIYSKIGTAEAYSYNTPAIQVNLQGADSNYPFGAGIVYMTGNGLNYAADYLADVIYKSIIIYNKKV